MRLRLYNNIEKFDEGREFENWLGKIATNVCLTWLARNKGDTGKEGSVGNVSYNDQYQEDAEKNNYRFMDGLSLKTIAEMMDVPESTLHNWIYRVKDRLAPILKKRIFFIK